ncbi:hypothetical protein GWN43_05110, partial [Candidatus Bathyarchaeota archaeon]|nr:hypothetical protein [Candidatus Bathyarchaeota archaeon]
MVGRAGRVGLDPRGDAYVLIAQHEAHKERPRIANIPEIRSCLEEFRALAFHVIAQVGEGGAKNVDDLYAWYSRSYAAYLGQTFSREDWQLLVDN